MKINDIEYEIGIYDLEGNFIDSTSDWDVLEKEFKINKTNVKSYLNCNSSFTGSYQLKFINTKLISVKFPVRIGDVIGLNNAGKPERPIAKYYKNKLITIYKTINEAEEKTKINRGTIFYSCTKGFKAGVYTFKYIQ